MQGTCREHPGTFREHAGNVLTLVVNFWPVAASRGLEVTALASEASSAHGGALARRRLSAGWIAQPELGHAQHVQLGRAVKQDLVDHKQSESKQ